jgi:DNA topoisomerase IA
LQQEASRRLRAHDNERRAAFIRSGLITYMRTDGIDIFPEAIPARATQLLQNSAKTMFLTRRASTKIKPKRTERNECIRLDLMLDAETAKLP